MLLHKLLLNSRPAKASGGGKLLENSKEDKMDVR